MPPGFGVLPWLSRESGRGADSRHLLCALHRGASGESLEDRGMGSQDLSKEGFGYMWALKDVSRGEEPRIFNGRYKAVRMMGKEDIWGGSFSAPFRPSS